MSDPKPCLGYMTGGILDNSTDLVEIWKKDPSRRDELGLRALEEIEQAEKNLAGLKQHIAIHLRRKQLKGIA